MTNTAAADLEAIRLEYRASLADLTFNSKPIITNLTIIAQENVGAAGAIVKAIEDQMRNAQPKQKLPVLYLMDSIMKNVGGAYISIFARNIVRTFASAFEQVDPADRQRFVKVLATWKNNPAGPLFAVPVLRELDNVVATKMREPAQRRPSLGAIHVNPNFVGLSPSVSPTAQAPPSGNNFANGGAYPQADGHSRNGTGRYPQRGPYDRPPSGRGRQDSAGLRRGVSNGQTRRETPVARAAPRSTYHSPQMPGGGSQPLNSSFNAGDIPPSGTNPSVDALKRQIELVLSQKQAVTLLNPLDTLTLGHIQVLTQLLQAVKTTTLDANSIQQISQMLQQYASTPQLTNPTPNFASLQPQLPMQQTASVLSSFLPPQPILTSAALGGFSLPQMTSTSFPAMANTYMPTMSTSQGMLPSSVQSLLSDPNALNGLLGTLTPGLVGGQQQQQQQQQLGNGLYANGMGSNGRANAPVVVMLSIEELPPIRLTHEDINKIYPNAVTLLYEGLDLQCRQCGTRHRRDENGRAKMDAHLDWHFRQNRRLKDKAKKAISRDWFVTEEEWIAEREVDVKDRKAPALFFEHEGETPAEPPEEVSNIPAAGQSNPRCAICTEPLEKFYDEETDDWMLRAAVRVDDVLYHQACYKDSQKSLQAAPTTTSPDTGASTPVSETEPASGGKRKREQGDGDDVKKIKTETSV
ncbi:uncharacterized protein EV422DRAFT_81543 [Fimicolochytrium jonesii]|uniref:uncharacterized protein n=1 Tax=Fimicolochytrium jonesii TaxID=1396493 RepID=UPI0022FF02A1|nr:uncharacterized protein EV422DRAFT_81543 [Fimicolochytrium jonesii]KAI8820170.1 hypothetical protein EV422DRAFT_81543 [Fimicolochytrium jonesii]